MTNSTKTAPQFTNSLQNIVKDFQVTFKHPAESKPTLPTLERFTNRKGWGSIEEAVEQLYVLSNTVEEFTQTIDTLHHYLDVAKEKQLQKPLIIDETDKIVALADGLGDELWFLLGDCVEAGIDIQPVIEIIKASNDSKLFIDEEGVSYPKEDENGKIMKNPDTFFAPEDKIKEEIKRQIIKANQHSLDNYKAVNLQETQKMQDALEKINKAIEDNNK